MPVAVFRNGLFCTFCICKLMLLMSLIKKSYCRCFSMQTRVKFYNAPCLDCVSDWQAPAAVMFGCVLLYS